MEQEQKIGCNFGCTRFVYNYYLALRQQKYKETTYYNWIANILPAPKTKGQKYSPLFWIFAPTKTRK